MAKKKVKKTLTEQLAEGLLELEPHQKIVRGKTGERIVEKTLPELVAEGLVVVENTQAVVGEGGGAKVVAKPAEILLAEGLKSPEELVAEGHVTPEQVRDGVVRRLRSEAETLFESHRTPNGYSLDHLARQKASFSHPYRHLPETDERKKELLDAGLIYPDAVLDEILDEVGKIQSAYRAAKKAVTTAFDKGQPVKKWASISLQDHLPGTKKKKAPKKTAARKKAPAKKTPSTKKASKKKTPKRGS